MKTGSFKELSNWQLVKKGFAVFLFFFMSPTLITVPCTVVYGLHTGIFHNGPCNHTPSGFGFIRIGIFCVQS